VILTGLPISGLNSPYEHVAKSIHCLFLARGKT
jgi:hypothetical protein